MTSPAGLEHLVKNLPAIRKREQIDFCIVNGENASLITGISPEAAKKLLAAGADVITGGNHTMRNRNLFGMLDEDGRLLRPINFGGGVPGAGYGVYDACGYRVLVLNAMGNVHMEPHLDAPLPFLERALAREAGKYDLAVLDIHAEATGEKLAIGYALDGRVTAVFGTHTHVPTADERILPCGTGYLSDVGMCGESGGILGMDPDVVLRRARTHLAEKFVPAAGPCVANAVIFTIDERRAVTTAVRRLNF